MGLLTKMASLRDVKSKSAGSGGKGSDDRSGMDVSYGTAMKWMHKDDGTGTNDVADSRAVKKVIQTIEENFPGALPVARVTNAVEELLSSHDVFPDNTLLATSLCYDELNRGIEGEFAARYGHAFAMGGLAGYCFGGNVGFGNMLHHAPGDGNVLLFYGPHVGVDMDATVGKVNRPNHRGSSECCGPAKFCLAYCREVREGGLEAPKVPKDIVASQQTWACMELLPLMDRVEASDNPDAELPKCLYDSQDAVVSRILSQASTQLNTGAHIALLGGITINTPEWVGEYFLPKKFVIVNDAGEVIKDMLAELLTAKAPKIKKRA